MSAEILQEIQFTYQRLQQAVAAVEHAYQHYQDELLAHYRRRLQAMEQAYLTQQKQTQEGLQAELAAIQATAETQIAQSRDLLAGLRSSFRWLLAPWDDESWQEYLPSPEAPVPSGVRLGRLVSEAEGALGELPALVDWLGVGHLFLYGADAEAARQVLQSILLRLVVTFPPGALRLSLADPVGLGANLSAFLRLPDTLRGDKVCSRPEEIARQLDLLEKHIETVIQSRLQNLYANVEEYNAQAGEIAVPYHILAVSEFPAGFDERMAERLLHIARNGPRTGVYLCLVINSQAALPRNFDLQDLLACGTVLQPCSDGWQWKDPETGAVTFSPDPLPPSERFNALLERVGEAFGQRATALPFVRIAIPPHERWQGNATDGLSVPIGISSTGEIHHLELGRGVVHHGLIGGITQSGKTNLLHVLIAQLALRYPPDELELYLLDFKEGVEFYPYLNLPHARVVGLESEREFGRSVLRRLQAEMEERSRRYKSAGVSALSAYRRAGGPLPRILLVMDEFQVLFGEDDRIAQESGRILEDLVRRGAAFGIHVLLSSQSPSASGMYGNRIYSQMGLRIALRCLPQEAQAILGEGNTAAGQLEQPGEAVYNDEMGHPQKNVLMRAALMTADDRQRALHAIRQLAQDRAYEPPVTFEGRAVARLELNPELQTLLAQPAWPSPSSTAHIWLGESIEIKPPTAAVLEHYPRSNLLILGGEEPEAYGLLLAALISLAAQHAPGRVRFFVADFARPESPVYGCFGRVSLPHPLTLLGPRQANGLLSELSAELDGGQFATLSYVLIAGLHRWRELRSSDPYMQSEPAKQLARLVEEGPELGLHFIIWADGMATVERVLKRGGLANFDLRVAFHLPEKDSNDFLGSNAAARLGENRALFRHEDWELGRLEKFKPYAIPDPQTLSRLLEPLQRRQVT